LPQWVPLSLQHQFPVPESLKNTKKIANFPFTLSHPDLRRGIETSQLIILPSNGFPFPAHNHFRFPKLKNSKKLPIFFTAFSPQISEGIETANYDFALNGSAFAHIISVPKLKIARNCYFLTLLTQI